MKLGLDSYSTRNSGLDPVVKDILKERHMISRELAEKGKKRRPLDGHGQSSAAAVQDSRSKRPHFLLFDELGSALGFERPVKDKLKLSQPQNHGAVNKKNSRQSDPEPHYPRTCLWPEGSRCLSNDRLIFDEQAGGGIISQVYSEFCPTDTRREPCSSALWPGGPPPSAI